MMKKNKIKLLAVIVAAITVMSAFSGCAGNKSGNQSSGSATAKSGAPLEFTFMSVTGEPFASHTENAVLEEVQKEANVKVNFIWVPATNYNDKISTTLASGTIPEIINGDYTCQALLLNQGAIVPIDDLLKTDGKNILAKFTADEYPFLRNADDGKIYGIPTIVDFPYAYTWSYREDMAQNVGITKDPVTWDDWKTMWMAVKTKDANKDGGKAQKVPYLGDIYSLMPVFDMNVSSNLGFMVDDKGKYMLAYDSPNFLKFLTEMQSLYKSGLLDPEFATRGNWIPGGAVLNAYESGLGFSSMSWAANNKDATVILQKSNPNALCKAVLPPKSPIDNSQRMAARNKLNYGACFTVSAKKSGKMTKLMNFFNFIYSNKGIKLMSYGIDGQMNKTENGKTTIISPYVNDFNTARSNGINYTPFTHFFSGDAYLQITLGGKSIDQVSAGTKQFYNGLLDNKPYLFDALPTFQTKAYVQYQAQIFPKIASLLDECVIGRISTDEFFKQYNALKPQGLQQIIDQASAAYIKVKSTK
jgi:putative aldouronate transport system substrate-binding protein